MRGRVPWFMAIMHGLVGPKSRAKASLINGEHVVSNSRVVFHVARKGN